MELNMKLKRLKTSFDELMNVKDAALAQAATSKVVYKKRR